MKGNVDRSVGNSGSIGSGFASECAPPCFTPILSSGCVTAWVGTQETSEAQFNESATQ